MAMLSIYSVVGHNFYGCSLYPFKRPKRIILISFQNLELLQGRSSSPVGYGIGIAEVVGSNPTRSISFCEETTVLNHACFWKLSDKPFSFFYSIIEHGFCLRCISKPRVEAILARVIPLHSMVAVAMLCRFCYYSCKAWRYKHWCITDSNFFTFVATLHTFNGKVNCRWNLQYPSLTIHIKLNWHWSNTCQFSNESC